MRDARPRPCQGWALFVLVRRLPNVVTLLLFSLAHACVRVSAAFAMGTFAQAMRTAADAADAFAAAGELPVAAAVAQAMQPVQAQLQALTAAQVQIIAALQPMQAQLQALTATQAQTTAVLADVHASVLRREVVACKSYNINCNDGSAHPFMPVPNATGALAPPGLAPLRSFAELEALNGAALTAWCAHYALADVPQQLAARRRRVAAELGAIPFSGELEL